MKGFTSSRYNFLVRGPARQAALFNSGSGALVVFSGQAASALGETLCSSSEVLSEDQFEPDIFRQLTDGGFLIPYGFDELIVIKDRYAKARDVTPAVLTVTVTMDCNLGCYYCYEERSNKHLTTDDLDAVLELAKDITVNRGNRSLHVDWYGGEPLLGVDFIESASSVLQSFCHASKISYASSVISNGTEWPEEVQSFVARNAIKQVQISFDGMAANHNKRRRFRKGRQTATGSSFERAVALVDKLVSCTRVDLRYNIDRKNQDDLIPFVRFAASRGWFKAEFPAVFQPARLASYSEKSAFMREYELTLEEFDALRTDIRGLLQNIARVEESEVPDGFPYPKTSVCAALSRNSIVVGADKHTYRCGLQVGNVRQAIGSIDNAERTSQDSYSDAVWWNNFDPTCLPTCSMCSFLPICWGGCPKRHIEGDTHAIQEQGKYWRDNLPRLLAHTVGFVEFSPTKFAEKDQFRLGTPKGAMIKPIPILLVSDAS